MNSLDQKAQKRLAGRSAVDALVARGLIKKGAKVGLGTGSTAMEAVLRIGELVADGTLADIRFTTTSLQTEIACEKLGIPFYPLSSREIGGSLDVTIDGADEIDPENRLVKGGGGALFREKLTAYNSKCFVIIADGSKLVAHLGTVFPVPVEVVPQARVPVCNALAALGAKTAVREAVRKCGPVITDNGNIIVDCLWPSPVDPLIMEEKIDSICGVVENGLFARHEVLVFAAKADGTLLERGKN